MAEYYNERSLLQGNNAPQFDVGALSRAGAITQQALGSVRDRELEEAKIAKDQKRWDITNARADAQEKRAADEYERSIREKNVTNDALRAVVDPNGYKASKMGIEQKAIENSIANLSPEDQIVARAEIAKNYSPEVSGKGWVDTASTAQGVDVGRVLDTKSRQYEMAAKTPGTPEYNAAMQAKMDMFKQEQAIANKYDMAKIGAQSAAQMNYLKATQDAPQKMVNPKTGEAKYVRPSELDKYPGYMDASTYSAVLADKREVAEKQRTFDFNMRQAMNKAKGELAETIGTYDDDSRNAIITGTANANTIIDEIAKADKKNIEGLSNTDINAMVKKSKDISIVGRDDLDNDLFRQSLASEISQKTGRPYEEILKRLEGIETKKPAVSTSTKPTYMPAAPSNINILDTEFGRPD